MTLVLDGPPGAATGVESTVGTLLPPELDLIAARRGTAGEAPSRRRHERPLRSQSELTVP